MQDIKKCPYCAEEIKIDAKKCRYCNEFLNDDESQILSGYLRKSSSISESKFASPDYALDYEVECEKCSYLFGDNSGSEPSGIPTCATMRMQDGQYVGTPMKKCFYMKEFICHQCGHVQLSLPKNDYHTMHDMLQLLEKIKNGDDSFPHSERTIVISAVSSCVAEFLSSILPIIILLFYTVMALIEPSSHKKESINNLGLVPFVFVSVLAYYIIFIILFFITYPIIKFVSWMFFYVLGNGLLMKTARYMYQVFGSFDSSIDGAKTFIIMCIAGFFLWLKMGNWSFF